MKYSIRKIHKKVSRLEEFQEVVCVCASDGEIASIIAEINDFNLCEEHGTPEQWAEKIVSALNKEVVDSLAV
ncbi:MAG: hypothetical protein FMNOHCHN_03494 [Ignavibacteriaceae bacterium]|nr:hypothetical protein [Ignavibacteriaceae bacterium]